MTSAGRGFRSIDYIETTGKVQDRYSAASSHSAAERGNTSTWLSLSSSPYYGPFEYYVVRFSSLLRACIYLFFLLPPYSFQQNGVSIVTTWLHERGNKSWHVSRQPPPSIIWILLSLYMPFTIYPVFLLYSLYVYGIIYFLSTTNNFLCFLCVCPAVAYFFFSSWASSLALLLICHLIYSTDVV